LLNFIWLIRYVTVIYHNIYNIEQGELPIIFEPITDKMCRIRIGGTYGKINIVINIYTPTEDSEMKKRIQLSRK